jgi:hypothetical protein
MLEQRVLQYFFLLLELNTSKYSSHVGLAHFLMSVKLGFKKKIAK